MEKSQVELTPMERREEIIGKLVMQYGKIVEGGQFDRAFNQLSPTLYDLRDVQYEIDRDKALSEAS